DNRPQVTLDVDYENGMGVSIGRLREDSMYDFKFIGLSHNTVRGAAGGAVLCAEALTAKGYIAKKYKRDRANVNWGRSKIENDYVPKHSIFTIAGGVLTWV